MVVINHLIRAVVPGIASPKCLFAFSLAAKQMLAPMLGEMSTVVNLHKNTPWVRTRLAMSEDVLISR